MLQHNKPISWGRANLSAPDFASPTELLDSFVHFLRQQYGVILSALLLTIALGVTYLVVTQPSYTAVATMLIDSRKSQFLQQQPSNSDVQIDPATVESQVRVLTSDNVALAVIKNLQLYGDPEFVGSSVISEPTAEYEATRRALSVFKSRLDVKRDDLSYVIEISFRSYDAEKAARVANAIVDAYIVDQLDAKYQSTLRASNWLQDRLRDLREQASAGEQAVVDYQREHNIVDAAGKSTSGQRVAELNSQLIIVLAQTAAAHAKLDRIQEVLSSNSSGAVDGTVDGTVADVLKNDVVTKLRSQYLDLASKEADWAGRYGPDHLAVVNLRNQMSEVRAAILDELRRLAETYKSDFEIAKQDSDDVQKQYDQAVAQAQQNNQAQVVLSDLESKAKTYRALYENFLQRYMDSVQQQSFPITEARLISPAAPPLRKSSPKTFLVLMISSCAGIIFGFGIGLLRDLWDRVFRTTEQAEKILHVRCLTLVPSLKGTAAPALQLADIKSGEVSSSSSMKNGVGLPISDKREGTLPPNNNASGSRTIAHTDNVLWTTIDSPFSRFSESMRAIKVAIDLNGVGKSCKVLGFTSSLPNEGKSTLSAALALLIAQAGGRVLLIDCDLRNPSLTRTLAPAAKAGLIEVISQKAAIEDVLWWSDPDSNLAFLPTVMKSRVAHTNEILASEATKQLFDELRQRYEYIIVDLSPLAPVVDVRTTAHLVNSYVCVIEWGCTKIDVVKKALDEASGVYEKLLGTILNKADISKLSRYEAHRGAYYDNKFYARYGYAEKSSPRSFFGFAKRMFL